jgi:hypothetical protein
LDIREISRIFAGEESYKTRKDMEATTTKHATQPGEFTVRISDISQFRHFKKAISMMRGVEQVKLPRRKQLTGYEQARRDVAEGRILSYDSLDDFIREIENG